MKKKIAAKDKRAKSGGKVRDLPARTNPRGGVSTSGYIVPCIKIRGVQPCIRTI
jgi:hypothetical protein